MGIIKIASKAQTERVAAPLKQMLKRCSTLLKKGKEDVPMKGHFAVYVGKSRARHVIPITLLNHPIFQMMLQEAEEEFGFRQERGITIPCDQNIFLFLVDSISYISS
ncbi:SAUR-like auxin-responsive protein family [Hirschfeldia incana]|nr:SAUR-like auxin-responsive protein family [Hirschfeldia incana]